MAVRVTQVDDGSPAARAGLRAGDELVSIDGEEIRDMLDYEFYTAQSTLCAAVRRGAQTLSLTITKDEYEPFGCEFETYLIDKHHSCKNKCIFCFVDQLPRGMRESLYFKDDDERLSFLFGNYITLTNLSRRELERIKKLHISPINVSVHTVDPALRVQMMKNRFAGNVLPLLRELAAAGIEMNCQLVLCRGINDGAALAQSMEELAALWPQVKSVAAVPIGVTRYREGLTPLAVYDRDSAAAVLDQMERFGERMAAAHGERIVYPADEWYLLAGRPLPPASFYGGYYQLDNGVGMCRKFIDEFEAELARPHRVKLPCRADTVVGESAYPIIAALAQQLERKYRFVRLRVHRVKNDFFGGNVSVTGLLTGQDIAAQLAGKMISGRLLLPSVTLRSEQDIFLDDMPYGELGRRLGAAVTVLPEDGGALVRAALGLPAAEAGK